MLRSMPVLLIIMIVALILVDSLIPVSIKQILFAMSLTIKSGIIFILPIIIFSLIFQTMVSMSGKATTVIAIILGAVMCSNFTAAFLSHYVGEWIHQFHFAMLTPQSDNSLQPLWQVSLPKLVDNSHAMFAGIILGILGGRFMSKPTLWLADLLSNFANKVINGLKYIIPVFVAGFIVKLQADGVIGLIVKDYSFIFMVIALAQCVYLMLAYFLLNKLHFTQTLKSIKNMLPAAIAGFSTMSSAAVMPLTLQAVEQNAKNKEMAKSVVPSTVNIHLLGDCIAIPIFAYALMSSFQMPIPALSVYFVFACYFVIAKFSVAAVPGGGILVMLPLLEAHLGFTPEMLSMVTALYILFDPVITCANVLGNGAMAKLVGDYLG